VVPEQVMVTSNKYMVLAHQSTYVQLDVHVLVEDLTFFDENHLQDHAYQTMSIIKKYLNNKEFL
jgi:hypothetical protein